MSHFEFDIYRALLSDHISAMLAYWDKDLVCRYANHAYSDWFGWSKEDMVNKITIRDLLGPELFEKNYPYITKALQGIPQQFEREIRTPGGEYRSSIADYHPHIEDGEVKGFFVHVTDITFIKNSEKNLQRTKQELEERIVGQAEELQQIFDRITDGFVAFDRDLRVTKLTERSAKIVDRPASDLVGKNIIEEFPWVRGTEIHHALLSSLNEQRVIYKEVYYPYFGKWIQHQIYPSPDGLSVFFRDITKKRNAEEMIRLNEERFQLAMQATKDGIWDWEINNNRQYVSPQWCEIIGYSYDDPELPHEYQEWERRIHPDHREYVMNALKEHLEQRKPYDVDYLLLHKSGEYRWQKSVGQAVFNEEGKPVRMVGSLSDIHDRKVAEEEINRKNEELHRLYSHVLNIREEERKRISREIHDELGQQLSFLKIEMNRIGKKPELQDPALQERMHTMVALLNDVISAVRKISGELRPSVLDNLGLNEAIEWHADHFATTTGVSLMFTSNIQKLALPQEKATGIYRIFQEALTNIAKHAGATMVTVTLDYAAGNLVLQVTDNGKGFTLSHAKKHDTLGLVGLQERSHLLGGNVKITSEPNRGTTVTLSIPVDETIVTLKEKQDENFVRG